MKNQEKNKSVKYKGTASILGIVIYLKNFQDKISFTSDKAEEK